MERYKILMEKADHGWTLSSPAFGIKIDALDGELDGAVGAMKRLMEKEAMARLEQGEFLPADDPLDPESGAAVLYVETAFEDGFVKSSETVRRNVSFPAWVDARLRRNNVDASRLFQDAALARLAELEATGRELRRIGSLEDLEAICRPGLLDEYFKSRMRRMIEDVPDGIGGKERR